MRFGRRFELRDTREQFGALIQALVGTGLECS
jgi:hypothetical protein